MNFCDSLELGKKVLPEEAVGILVEYHQVTKHEILKGFFNLGKYLEITSRVEFREGINNGNPCIIMAGFDERGIQIWYAPIDKYSGLPQNFCG